MMISTSILAVLIPLLLAIYYLVTSSSIRRNGARLRRPPNTLPLAGNGILFLQARHKLFSWFVKCERLFGFETFEISVPSLPPGVVINDPKNLEYVLKNEGLFTKGEFFKGRSRDLFGNGIINADGDLWKVQRKAGLHFLSNSNLKVLTDVALPLYLKTAMSKLAALSPQDVVDLEIVIHEVTTQLMGRMAYDMDMHAEDPFAVSFEYASGQTAERFQNPLYKITEPILGAEFRRSIDVVKKFGNAIVGNAVRKRESKPAAAASTPRGIEHLRGDGTAGSITGSLINSLLDSLNDDQLVADAALNYLSAGRDTTAQGLTWTFYLLMRHPAVVASIRRELAAALRACGQSSASSPGPGPGPGASPFASSASASSAEQQPGPAEIDASLLLLLRPAALPYTMAVFYEALRLYPPVPFELKQCEAATTLPDGTALPRGAIVVWSPWAMGRSRLIWGSGSGTNTGNGNDNGNGASHGAADTEAFVPARWIAADGTLLTRTAFEYPVFNGGPRTCLGKKMAEHVALQAIAKLVWEFDFASVDGRERVSKNSLTLPMEGGLPCHVRRASFAEREQVGNARFA